MITGSLKKHNKTKKLKKSRKEKRQIQRAMTIEEFPFPITDKLNMLLPVEPTNHFYKGLRDQIENSHLSKKQHAEVNNDFRKKILKSKI